MFLDILKLGIKDIFKYKREFLILELVIMIITLISISSFGSMISVFESEKFETYYSAVPISYDQKEKDSIINRLDSIFKKGGYTYFYSDYVNTKFDVEVLVLVGKYEDRSENNIIWCVPKEDLRKLKNSSLGKIEIINSRKINEKKMELIGMENLLKDKSVQLIKFEGEEFKNLANYQIADIELIALSEEAKLADNIDNNDVHKEFEKAFENTFLHLQKDEFSNIEEISFVKRFMSVYIIVSIMVVALGIVIVTKHIYAKLHREYIIHLICGATKLNIFIRNSIFLMFLIGINFLFMGYLNAFHIDAFFIINIFISLIFIIIFELITLRILIKEDLSIKLEGE